MWVEDEALSSVVLGICGAAEDLEAVLGRK